MLIKNKKGFWILIAVVLCFIPMFFPNALVTDWGSDWAFYLHQARNIVNGIPQLDNGFIINEACFEISSKAYPIGFPLLLASVYTFFGENIPAFITLQTFILFLLGMTWFFTFRKRMGEFLAILGIFFIVYSPYVIWFRNNILSEYSYLLFQSLFILVYIFQKREKKWWLLGVLYGIAWIMKGGGVQLIFSAFLFELSTLLMHTKSPSVMQLAAKKIKLLFGIFVVGLFINLAFNKLFFNTGDSFGFYVKIYQEKFSLDQCLLNFKYYLNEIYYSFFVYWQTKWFGFLGALAFLYFLINGFKKLVGREKLIVFVLIIQLVSIIAFPFQQGMRYALPIMPLIVYVMLKGLKTSFPKNKMLKIITLVIFGGFVFSQVNGINSFNKQVSDSINWTPYTYETALGWQFIKNNTPKDAVFVTAFPRVLSFFTERPAYNPCVLSSEEIKNDMIKNNAKYIILNKQTEKWVPTLEPFVKAKVSKLDTVYINEEVVILKVK